MYGSNEWSDQSDRSSEWSDWSDIVTESDDSSSDDDIQHVDVKRVQSYASIVVTGVKTDNSLQNSNTEEPYQTELDYMYDHGIKKCYNRYGLLYYVRF